MRSSHGRDAARWAIHPSSFHSWVGAEDDAGGRRRHLGGLGERVGPERGSRRRPRGPRTCSGARAGPRGRRSPTRRTPPSDAHRVDAAVPAVPVADHPHRAGPGRPHGERGALGALVGAGVGAEHGPQPVVAALADQVEVEVAERRPERPRVDHRVVAAAVPPERDRVAGRRLGVDQHLEHAVVVDAAHGPPVERGRRRRPAATARTTTWSPSWWTPSTRCGSRHVPAASAATSAAMSVWCDGGRIVSLRRAPACGARRRPGCPPSRAGAPARR